MSILVKPTLWKFLPYRREKVFVRPFECRILRNFKN